MIELNEKLKFIRKQEKLTQAEFAKLIDVKKSSYANWESQSIKIPAEALTKTINHPRFKKYTLFLTNEDSDESIGRMSAELKETNTTATEFISELLDLADDDQIEAIDNFVEQLMTFRRQANASKRQKQTPDHDD